MYKIFVKQNKGVFEVSSKINDKFTIGIAGEKDELKTLIEAVQNGLKVVCIKQCQDGDMYETYINDPLKWKIPDNQTLNSMVADFEVVYN